MTTKSTKKQMKMIRKLLSIFMATVFIISALFSVKPTVMQTSASTLPEKICAGPYKPEDTIIKQSSNKQRRITYQVWASEYTTPERNVPLQALHNGVGIYSPNTKFTLTIEEAMSSTYTTEKTILYGIQDSNTASVGIDIELIKAGYSEGFATTFQNSFSDSMSTTHEIKRTQEWEYTVKDSADYGFYTITLEATHARKCEIEILWWEYEESFDSKGKLTTSNLVNQGSYSTFFYVPNEDAIISANSTRFADAVEYYFHLKKFNAIY